jgi:hypothetical protein
MLAIEEGRGIELELADADGRCFTSDVEDGRFMASKP